MAESKKVRVSRRVLEYLAGSDVGHFVDGLGPDVGAHPSDVSMQRKILVEAKQVKDGSVTVELDFDEAWSLYGYTAAMTAGAADNATFDDSDARSDLVSGRALLRKLEDLFGREVTGYVRS